MKQNKKALNYYKLFAFLIGLTAIFVGLFYNFISQDNKNTFALIDSEKIQKKAKIKVGIQAGHWQNDQLPDEFLNLRAYGGGVTYRELEEWEVNYNIGKKLQTILVEVGFEAELLPATIPEGYEADAFIALHADGNDYSYVNGFKMASSVFDQTNQADKLADEIEKYYQTKTQLKKDLNITKDMTHYYAFNYQKFTHSVSSKTPAVIIELGFLTNAHDRDLLLNHSDRVAQAIGDGVINYFNK